MAWSSEITGMVMRNAVMGESYTAALTIVGDEGVAIVKGLVAQDEFTSQDWRDVTDELFRRGFRTMRFHRKGGRWRTVTLEAPLT